MEWFWGIDCKTTIMEHEILLSRIDRYVQAPPHTRRSGWEESDWNEEGRQVDTGT